MERTRQYDFEGVHMEIPMHYDAKAGIYIEEYPDFIESPVWTPEGYPVMFAGEDACPEAQERDPGGCPDCGSCRFYRPAAEHSWIGVCHRQRRSGRSLEPGPPGIEHDAAEQLQENKKEDRV